MISEKTQIEQEELAKCLWTIGDINRLRLLQLLPTTAECKHRNNVGQLADRLGMSQPTVSNHLARLRTLGIVRHTKMCRDVYYWIDQEKANEVLGGLAKALKVVEKKVL